MGEFDDKIINIIYGLREYSKIPYEVRFSLVKDLISIKSISEETANKIIYKLEEQLRIRTSNLNRAINNPKRKITKKEVIEFIEFLNRITSKKGTEKIEKTDVRMKTLDKEKEEEDSLILLENNTITIKNFNLILLKKIINFIFSLFKKEGVNIIYKKNKTLIIPRSIGDNKINLRRTSKKEIKEIHRLITNEEINKRGYKEITEEPVEIKTSKKIDSSLENLLSNQKRDFTPIKNEDDEIKIEKENEKIAIEKEPKSDIEIEEVKDTDYIIFSDEKVDINVSKKKPLGIIEIRTKNNTLEDFTYALVLSKYLSVLIFNTLKCEGTNIIYKKNKFLVIPRVKEDNLITLPRKEVQKRDLEFIHSKLTEEKREERAEIKVINDTKKEEETREDNELKEKAKEILERLRRIP